MMGPHRSSEFSQKVYGLRVLLDLGVRVAFIGAAVVLSYSALFRPVQTAPTDERAKGPSKKEAALPTAGVSLDGATLRGERSARVALIEYSDFQCPFCSKFALETLPTLEKRYVSTGRVLLAFRHVPLPIHGQAQKAAEAAECAAVHGKFWEMHDLLFQDRRRLADADLESYAGRIGLEQNRFQSCMAGTMTDKVRSEAAAAKALDITSTPSFFLGTLEQGAVRVRHRITGARPLREFEAVLEALLSLPAR